MKRLIALLAIPLFLLSSCKQAENKEENAAAPVTPEQRSQVPAPEWSKNSVIYEVNLRQFTPSGSIAEFMDHIPRLKALGVDILWFMPIFPVGEKNRKGSLGSYYAVKDYRAVNPEFGSMDEFKALVDAVHAAGMYVILDWVANHSAWDNHLITEHPEWYTQDSLGDIIVPEGTDWTDVADFNYEEPGLWDYMRGSLEYWVKEANVDGFRCDVAGMVPTEFWKQAYDSLIVIRPDIFMLAEWEAPELHEAAFHMSYAWNMHHALNRIARGEMGPDGLDSMLTMEAGRFLPSAYRMNFTSNHDENSWNGTALERMGDAHECLAALTYVLPGMPLIYSGQEAGINKRLAFFDKDTIEWREDPMASIYTRLNTLKHENPAIWNGSWGGDWKRIDTEAEDVFALLRNKDSHHVLGIFNLGPNTSRYEFNEESAGAYTKLNGEGFIAQPGQVQQLGPWDYLILSN